MRIRNRYLSNLLHRLCNAVLGLVVTATVALAINPQLPSRWQPTGLAGAIGVTVLAALTLAVVDLKRFSIIEGVAGDAVTMGSKTATPRSKR
jgi:hypothetical protein